MRVIKPTCMELDIATFQMRRLSQGTWDNMWLGEILCIVVRGEGFEDLHVAFCQVLHIRTCKKKIELLKSTAKRAWYANTYCSSQHEARYTVQEVLGFMFSRLPIITYALLGPDSTLIPACIRWIGARRAPDQPFMISLAHHIVGLSVGRGITAYPWGFRPIDTSWTRPLTKALQSSRQVGSFFRLVIL